MQGSSLPKAESTWAEQLEEIPPEVEDRVTNYQLGLALPVCEKKMQSNSGVNMIAGYFSFRPKSLSQGHSLMSGTQNLLTLLFSYV